jgi:hypothetical protein
LRLQVPSDDVTGGQGRAWSDLQAGSHQQSDFRPTETFGRKPPETEASSGKINSITFERDRERQTDGEKEWERQKETQWKKRKEKETNRNREKISKRERKIDMHIQRETHINKKEQSPWKATENNPNQNQIRLGKIDSDNRLNPFSIFRTESRKKRGKLDLRNEAKSFCRSSRSSTSSSASTTTPTPTAKMK